MKRALAIEEKTMTSCLVLSRLVWSCKPASAFRWRRAAAETIAKWVDGDQPCGKKACQREKERTRKLSLHLTPPVTRGEPGLLLRCECKRTFENWEQNTYFGELPQQWTVACRMPIVERKKNCIMDGKWPVGI